MDSATTRSEIAARLKEARSALFPTAAEAARALGMKPVTVRAHESGQNGVDYFDLERYARRYGVDIAWLLTGEGAHEPQIAFHTQIGELVNILGLIQDGAWIPDPIPDDPDEESDEYPIMMFKPRSHDGEFVTYSDPRFP